MKQEKTQLLLYPEDKIALCFSAVVILIQISYFISGVLKDIIQILIPVIALLVLSVFIFTRISSSSGTLRFFRSYLHIPFYGIIFAAFQRFVHILNPNDYDPFLLKADLFLFGFDITVWFEQFISKALTEVLTLSYFSYYILPTLTFVILYFSKNTDSFIKARNYLLAIVIGWYGAFVFYMVLPAAGPDIAYSSHYNVPLAGLSPLTNTYLQNLSVYLKESFVRNTFPSMHFGILLITNYFAFKYKRTYFLLCTLPSCIMLAVATVYLRQHYLIDLLGSVPVAVVSIYMPWHVSTNYYYTYFIKTIFISAL